MLVVDDARVVVIVVGVVACFPVMDAVLMLGLLDIFCNNCIANQNGIWNQYKYSKKFLCIVIVFMFFFLFFIMIMLFQYLFYRKAV